MTRLIWLFNKCHYEIAYDFAHQLPGADLGELWRARRFTEILAYVERLPASSKTWAFLANDDDFASQTYEAALKEKKKSRTSERDETRFSPENFGMTESILADLITEVRQLQAIVKAVNGGRYTRPVPYDRLVTKTMLAAKRGAFARRQRSHDEMLAQLLPDRKAD